MKIYYKHEKHLPEAMFGNMGIMTLKLTSVLIFESLSLRITRETTKMGSLLSKVVKHNSGNWKTITSYSKHSISKKIRNLLIETRTCTVEIFKGLSKPLLYCTIK